MQNLGALRKMSTLARCIFREGEDAPESPRYRVVAFCHENYVADYKFDKGRALVLVTGIELTIEEPPEFEILAESITMVIADDAARVRTAMSMQMDASASLPMECTPYYVPVE